jgi:16S rRNA C967 or C1407 C5-methylase (RsmB/RsmF family)
MCAAPGSKTAQIIEAVHANDKINEIPSKSLIMMYFSTYITLLILG